PAGRSAALAQHRDGERERTRQCPKPSHRIAFVVVVRGALSASDRYPRRFQAPSVSSRAGGCRGGATTEGESKRRTACAQYNGASGHLRRLERGVEAAKDRAWMAAGEWTTIERRHGQHFLG